MDGITGDDPPPVSLSEEDMDELKEVIVEFLALNRYLYHKRVQKLVFAGEIFSAQQTGHRLTDASFCPYSYGPYSQAVENALENLVDENRITLERIPPNKKKYHTSATGGELSPRKKFIVQSVFEKYKGVPTEDIVADVKDSRVYREFEEGEEIDFVKYIDEYVRPPSEQAFPDERNPIPEEEMKKILK